MKILVACEFSGRVRRAFAARGHYVFSCDLLEAEDGHHLHIRRDVMHLLDLGWDMLIAFPPCTHLCSSGARWFKDKVFEQMEAIQFVQKLWDAPIPRIAIENPVGVLSRHIRKPDQVIQPWQFGDGYTKSTCLWLKGLPKLTPTNIVEGRDDMIHRMPPGPERAKNRARTFPGIALAMAEQWG